MSDFLSVRSNKISIESSHDIIFINEIEIFYSEKSINHTIFFENFIFECKSGNPEIFKTDKLRKPTTNLNLLWRIIFF